MARGNSVSASAAALTTKSLNDGAGCSPAAALSCLRSSTASSMSTSTLRTNSGAVAFDSAIRRATVCCRRVSSWRLGRRRGRSAPSPTDRAGRAGAPPSRAPPPSAGASVGAAPRPPAAPRRPPAASTSAFTIRPPGPVPSSAASSRPISRAIRRATGLGLDAARSRRLASSPARPRPASGSSSASGSCSASGSVLAGLGLGLLLGLGLRLAPRPRSASGSRLLPRAPACGSASGSSLARSAPRRRRRSAASPMLAIVSPTASVSPSEADDAQDAVLVGLVGHVGLVRLDLDELLAALDLVPVGLQPLEDRALLHRVGQAGHRDVGHGPEDNSGHGRTARAALARAPASDERRARAPRGA